MSALTDARLLVLRRGHAVERWHRADREWHGACVLLLAALDAGGRPPWRPLDDLRMGEFVARNRTRIVEAELVELNEALDAALIVLAGEPLPWEVAA